MQRGWLKDTPKAFRKIQLEASGSVEYGLAWAHLEDEPIRIGGLV